ncbi:hypothetical protein C2845_PM07G28230 [Panicum miliaceum]|uniref:F-box/LRR-repeat protein 15/At3g58940/PEG3-like LRR domain-containing protein n=1 Tax=Panicum miliaceum TaxID=4540 RepID=A0A3L6SPC0_PANMI|nr:hypothetical protein C2845_PM07G28230 [Panicum miliaceum]
MHLPAEAQVPGHPDRCFGEREELSEVIVEDAASLERLLLHEVDNGPSVRITGAEKLKILGYLGVGFPIVELGNSSFKGLVPVSLVEQFSTVKILALEMPEALMLKVVIGYLRCFPCLEKLHITFFVKKWRSLKGIEPFNPSAPNQVPRPQPQDHHAVTIFRSEATSRVCQVLRGESKGP